MKRVVSVSLGSSKRNHAVETEILGEKFCIERIGTDGNKEELIRKIRELDGKVDAFGLGGTDLYLQAGNKRYVIRESLKFATAAQKTPIVDGSGLKDTLERKITEYLLNNVDLGLRDKRILLVCAIDRFGMAETFQKFGCRVVFGDLIFALGVPFPLKKLKTLERIANIAMPVLSHVPIKYLYPIGEQQEKKVLKHQRFFKDYDIIAGDFHFINRYAPEDLSGKTILTNTVTKDDVVELKRRGLDLLITTTPELNGRSFGTNVMEAVLVAILQKPASQITSQDYHNLLERIDFKPRIEKLR